MKTLFTALILILNVSVIYAQSEAKAYADGKPTTQIVPGTETYTFEFMINSKDAAKAFSSPMNITNSVSYVLYIGGGDEAYQLDNIYWGNRTKEGFKNWKKVANAGEIVTETVDGDEINDVLRVLKEKGWPDKDMKFKVWIETPANLNGDMVTLSETWMTIPASLKSGYLAAGNQDTYNFFKSGGASNVVNNPGLADAIERYMETKWPNEDITTINLRYFSFKDASQSSFKFEGYYITRKNGVCKYNSCYGDGVKASSYSITFFNSMNAEKTVSCDVADKLRNR